MGSVGRKNVFCVLTITSWRRVCVCDCLPLPTQHSAHGLCLLRRQTGRFGCHLPAPAPVPRVGSVQPHTLSPPCSLVKSPSPTWPAEAPSLFHPCILFLFSLLVPSPFITHQSLLFLKQTTSSQPQFLPFFTFRLPLLSELSFLGAALKLSAFMEISE